MQKLRQKELDRCVLQGQACDCVQAGSCGARPVWGGGWRVSRLQRRTAPHFTPHTPPHNGPAHREPTYNPELGLAVEQLKEGTTIEHLWSVL